MKQVKKLVHYWCEDTINGTHLGQGIGVAVLDTGIARHPDFEDRIRVFGDVVNRRTKTYDDNGHGTHVAGIIGGSGRLSKGEFAGMAPLCSLIVLKVLDQKGNGDIRYVLDGVEWVLRNFRKYQIRIVNISVGTLPHVGSEAEKKLVEAVEKLWDNGLIVVAAAGNYGPGRGTITTPGISKKIITVGSSNDQYYTDTKGNKKKSYSGRGPTEECVCKPDVVAPGSYITSCSIKKPYTVKSGTSMSTPIVSGALAVLLSKYPDMSNVEAKLRLRQTCDDLKKPVNQQGWGILNMYKLLGV